MIARRFRRLVVPLVVGAIGLGLTACSNTVSDAATVTYHDRSGSHTIHISRADFKNQLGELVGSTQFQTLLKSASFSLVGDQKNTTGTDVSTSYLSQIVEQAAVDAEFSELKLEITPAERTAAVLHSKQAFGLSSEFSQDAQGNQVWVGPGVVYASFPKALQDVLVDRQARADAVATYYSTPTIAKEQALYDEFATTICPSGRLVAQILVKDAQTASSIVAQLRGGASFADLARTKSTDTTSAKTGGSVGCLRRNVFVKEFETAAYAAPFGVPTGPVKSSLGYHVILVGHASFAALQAQLTQALQQNPLLARDLRLQEMHVWINPQFGVGGLAVDSQRGQLLYRVAPPAVPSVRTCREKPFPCSTTTTTPTTAPAGG
jgi:PPIC-type PPIASE domain